jgi:hypothetical protein
VREIQKFNFGQCFSTLKSIPKLFGAKVETKFLFYNHNDDDTDTISNDQAVIEQISAKVAILDFTLSYCVMGVKRIPGFHHYDQDLMLEHLLVINEGHSDVVWDQTPAPRPRLYPKPRQDLNLILRKILSRTGNISNASQVFGQKLLHHNHD